VQRLFSMFPRGLPGLALLLLRTSVACGVLLHAYGHRGELAVGLLVGSVLVATMLFIGLLTPVVALLALAVQLALPLMCSVDFLCAGYIAISILNALALSMLGPGAYSIDAYRFGRRVIDLPPPQDQDSF
jgi:hypothetical protein